LTRATIPCPLSPTTECAVTKLRSGSAHGTKEEISFAIAERGVSPQRLFGYGDG